MSMVETAVGPVPPEDLRAWELFIHYLTPILSYYVDPGVTEIRVNRYNKVFVIGREGKQRVDAAWSNDEELRRCMWQLSVALNQHDENALYLDARLPDQSRASCIWPGLSPAGSSMTLRVAPKTPLTADDLLRFSALTPEMLAYLKRAVELRRTILVSGTTNSGKTALLRVLARYFDPDDNVLTCEDTQELFFDHLDESKPLEAPRRKDASISMAELIKISMRQSPDRIVVGEIRDGHAADAFLQAINTGHEGCMTTLHANSPVDAISRISYLIAAHTRLSYELANRQLYDSVNVLVQAVRTPSGERRLSEIAEVINGDVVTLFKYQQEAKTHYVIDDALARSRVWNSLPTTIRQLSR